jgi:hypothetical protein
MNPLFLIALGTASVAGVAAWYYLSSREEVDDEMKRKIMKIVAQIESRNNYGEVFIDPGVELSYGLLQTRMKYGGLGRLLRSYINEGGRYVSEMERYIDRVEAEDRSLEHDSGFHTLLKRAGADPVMKEAQDEYFSKDYLQRAYDFAEEKEFELPVSQLAIVDTFIHSGSEAPFKWAGITTFPSDGEDEIDVLRRYLTWRQAWLKRKSAVLAKTAFRPALYLELLGEDPYLEHPVTVAGGTIS